ncbi:DUF4230 domain-containing protein [Streptomyces sp. 184]|uniref:DUF4230 domain-containing protein n=1 Tax=Streptomyces sp. 184 TaxID=1827526 RepID=UPI003891D0CB
MRIVLRKSEGPGSERQAPGRKWLPLAALVAAAVLVLVVVARSSLLPGFGDIFEESTEDNTGPALLESIRDLSRYEGAAGDFQVVVDLEKDTKYVPDAIKGQRTLFVGAGSVGAYVEMGKVGQKQVRVNDERTSATLRLPHARLAKPALDADRSYAVSKDRGLLDRLGDLFSGNPADERAVHRLASDHIAKAARGAGLAARAEKNTTAMLEGLLHSLGFERVKVTYV